ncbi:hypothetical protein JB92DRAFT_3113380 [Gautieria morchelliformis]|nr:hypothetical protein JB92DRAFT_3113380 [Gautieria morchelliformis]
MDIESNIEYAPPLTKHQSGELSESELPEFQPGAPESLQADDLDHASNPELLKEMGVLPDSTSYETEYKAICDHYYAFLCETSPVPTRWGKDTSAPMDTAHNLDSIEDSVSNHYNSYSTSSVDSLAAQWVFKISKGNDPDSHPWTSSLSPCPSSEGSDGQDSDDPETSTTPASTPGQMDSVAY